MTKLTIGVGIAGVVVGLLIGSVMLSGGQSTGGVYSQVAGHFSQGIVAGLNSEASIDSSGNFVTTGDIAATTAANASSTLTVGQIETYATSSATKVCLKFNTIATSSQAGYVLWNYGACP